MCQLSNALITLNTILVNAGTNKQHVATKNTAKLDRETEELKHKGISTDVARLIQQGRQAKGLSQKDLATKINEKPQIVSEYEAGKLHSLILLHTKSVKPHFSFVGRGIANNVVLGKIERVLGIKLRGNIAAAK